MIENYCMEIIFHLKRNLPHYVHSDMMTYHKQEVQSCIQCYRPFIMIMDMQHFYDHGYLYENFITYW